MRTAETTVRNPTGIHMRPGAMFVRAAAGFTSTITLENLDFPGSAAANAKSLTLVLNTKSRIGNRIRITAEGPDEDAAIEGMIAFVDAGCGEKLEG